MDDFLVYLFLMMAFAFGFLFGFKAGSTFIKELEAEKQ